MSGWRDVVLDAWSAVAHKAPLREDSDSRRHGWSPKGWIPEADRRRIAAYAVLAGYDSNVARFFTNPAPGADVGEVDDRREYGDAALVIDTTLANLLGDEQIIVVPGAEGFDPDDEDSDPDARAAAETQDLLREWAKREAFALSVQDAERKAVRDGDSVYLLSWSSRKQRPVHTVLDGGFYFPVLPDSLDAAEYPSRVHFAWELAGSDGKTRVRRITYDLRRIEGRYDPDTDTFVYREGDVVDAEGRVTRVYPWDPTPSEFTCYLTDATWLLDDTGEGIDALSPATATYAVNDDGEVLDNVDLGLDFIPAVHIANTPAGADHFGQSSLAKVLQLLDDLHSADTDTAKAAATTGSPIIALSGSQVKDQQRVVGPGEVWGLGENGAMDVLDTAAQLAGMREYVEFLLKRLSTNSRLPGTVTGQQSIGDIDSDFRALVAMQPLIAMVRSMRLTRSVKYPLLFKFILRLMQAGGTLPAGPLPDADLQLGSFLPQDAGKVLEQVIKGLAGHAISLETGVVMLVAAGYPISDATEEVTRIQKRMFEQANHLADATNDVDAVREFLDLPKLAEPPVPAVGDPAAAADAAPVVPVPTVIPTPPDLPEPETEDTP